MRSTPLKLFFLGIIGCLAPNSGSQAAQTNVTFGFTQTWKYNQTQNLDGINWNTPAYNDAAWPGGAGLLTYETCGCLPQPINTTLSTNTGRMTFYFRTQFTFAGDPAATSLLFSNLIDDGAVFYLNGSEIQRVGMPAGTITYSTGAARTVGDATAYDEFTVLGTNLIAGTNLLAVEVHQVNSTSSDVVFGCALATYDTQTNVTRGPYLQLGTPTSVVVRWRTDFPTESRVRYGTNVAALNWFVDDPALTNEHEVALAGLLPDTKYFYSIGTASETLAGGDTNHFFVTSPLAGTPKVTRIWVLGDSGTANANQAAVRDAYYGFTGSRHTDLWLMLGDNAYPNGTDSEYQAAVFNMYPAMLRKSVLWPTLGNHDTYSTNPNGNYAYLDIFTLPTAGQAGGFASGTERYYSFDYANVHFICLDSMTANRSPSAAMAMWLTNDLANTTQTWVIAFWHHPPYSKGSHNSDSFTDSAGALVEMRTNLVPLLEAGGVDLVLTGHSHSYERSYLLDGHYGLSTTLDTNTMILDSGSGRENGSGAYVKPAGGPIAHQGAVYVVAGSSGQISGGTLNHPAMFISLNNLGSLVLDISSNRLDAKFIRETGATNDYFTILKQNYAPVASNLNFTINADAATNLALAASDINGDPVSLVTNSLPTSGLISSFVAGNGAFTYTPAHAFSGGDSFTFHATDGMTNSTSATVNITVLSPTDANTNGLPDAWETAYGVTDPDADDDNDGLTNLEEYLANTIPTNNASALRITAITNDLSGFSHLTWASIGGTRYRVQFSDGDSGSFNGLFSNIVRAVTLEMDAALVGSASTQSFTDDFTLTGSSPASGARYYRLEVVR